MGKNNMFYGGIVFLVCAMFMIPCSVSGLELQKKGFADKSFIGGRIGAWSNIGDDNTPAGSDFDGDFSSSAVYGEFFYAYRVAAPLALEFSLGIYSRGDIEYSSQTNVFIGAVNIYPILVSAKLYPLYSFGQLPFHLYFQPGGGVVYANQTIIDYDDYYYYYYYGYTGEESETKLTYFLGGGVEVPVSDKIGLTMNYKYIPVEFGEPLAELKDYSGWTLTFGVGYIF